MSWYCTECHTHHEEWMDIAGNCFIAEAWRESHDDFETEDDWWVEFMPQVWRDRAERLPYYKVTHHCFHTTLERHNVPMSWCRDCQVRMDNQRRGLL